MLGGLHCHETLKKKINKNFSHKKVYNILSNLAHHKKKILGEKFKIHILRPHNKPYESKSL
jgi:hypothetical protein